MKKLLSITFFSFLLITNFSWGQTYNNPGGIITTCSGSFYDTGGSGSNYSNDETIITTFCTSVPGQCMQINFTSFNIENGYDFLTIYDGPATTFPVLGTFTGALGGGTITSTTGCITFKFTSDFSVTQSGWAATISCVACAPYPDYTQPIVADAGGEKVGACLVNDCGPFTYTDDGGFSGNYSNNIDATGAPNYTPQNAVYRVFCPDVAGQCMRVTFNSFRTRDINDVLWVRNGSTEYSPNFTSPPTQTTNWPSPPNPSSYDNGLYGNLNGFAPFSFTSTDSSGCLTFAFLTDNSGTRAGWNAVMQCVPCAVGPTGTANNDCPRATPICGTANINSNATGPGLISEGCNYGTCPAGGENHTNWFTFTISASGTLRILINPTTPTDDYDFAIYGPGATCGNLGPALRCSDSGVQGQTGMNTTATDLTETQSGDSYVAEMNVLVGETYIMVIDEWSANSGGGYQLSFGGTALLDCTVLPIELTEFNAEYQSDLDVVDLYWETASERNNDHFELEKSTDGYNFEVINKIKGVGNSNYTSMYYSVDNNPSVGVNYYRLNQFDIDGKSKYSEIISINILDDAYDLLSVFPNPTTGQTQVIFNSYKKEKVGLKVLSHDGRVIVNTDIDAYSGGNKFDLDLTGYHSGFYFITITTSEKTYTTKLFKK